LTGKVPIVTGGGRGIGRAHAIALAKEGAAVLVNDLGGDLSGEGSPSSHPAEDVAAAIEAGGGRAATDTTDISDWDGAHTVVDAALKAFGRLDIVVNNAGITRDSTMRRLDRTMWQAVIDTNLGSCFNVSKAVWDGMNTRGFGRIVNIGSINGQGGQYGQVNYAAAKSGIHGFTKALAQEGAAKGITVNAIAPGYTDTDMVSAVPAAVLEKIVAKIPVGRLGKADEIARGVMFLIADDAGFITGSTLSINGGQHMY
jgi:acetoacetyl-CoA reductase